MVVLAHHRFRSMVRIYYRGAAAAVLVFDMTDRQTFMKLKDWVLGAQPQTCHIDAWRT